MRYERKFIIEGLPLHKIEEAIWGHPVGFTVDHPDRKVNNIYFDDMGFSNFQLHNVGEGERRKFRIRWYGYETEHIADPVFEVKSKHGELSKKTLIKIGPFDTRGFQTLLQFPKLASLGFLQPGLYNSYTRSYYKSFDGKFRLTVDRNMEYRPFNVGVGISQSKFTEDGVMVELKYDEQYDNEWENIADHFPYRVSNSSKYISGMMLLSA